MPLDIFELVSELEIHIAELYGKMKIISRFRDYFDTFRLMEEISFDHSEKIKDLMKKYTVAAFDRISVIKIHDKIKNKLWENVIDSNDEKSIIKKMSESEESVGKLYYAIAAYYKKLSEYYNSISKEMEIIAGEEFDHKELLLKLIQ
jgi:hypothetical protein